LGGGGCKKGRREEGQLLKRSLKGVIPFTRKKTRSEWALKRTPFVLEKKKNHWEEKNACQARNNRIKIGAPDGERGEILLASLEKGERRKSSCEGGGGSTVIPL